MVEQDDYTPALGKVGFTRAYDVAIRMLTREHIWRAALLAQLAPRHGETILDVGCGTGSFAIMIKRATPGARVIGIDPDNTVLELAAAKAKNAGLQIEWKRGFARDAAVLAGPVNKAVSSLVFHQTPLLEKHAGLAAMFESVVAGGEVHVADYARQPDNLMRAFFRLTVQRLDGLDDTQPNADGALEQAMSSLAGEGIGPLQTIRTPTGAISLFRMTKS